MSESGAAVKLLITQRAVRDLLEVQEHSSAQWGEQVAAKYMEAIEAALVRLQQNPALLMPEADFHPHLCFYRVNKHVLVCDVQPKRVFVLTVIHASRDIPTRLAELAPSLAAEAELLHEKLRQRKQQ